MEQFQCFSSNAAHFIGSDKTFKSYWKSEKGESTAGDHSLRLMIWTQFSLQLTRSMASVMSFIIYEAVLSLLIIIIHKKTRKDVLMQNRIRVICARAKKSLCNHLYFKRWLPLYLQKKSGRGGSNMYPSCVLVWKGGGLIILNASLCIPLSAWGSCLNLRHTAEVHLVHYLYTIVTLSDSSSPAFQRKELNLEPSARKSDTLPLIYNPT